MAFIPTGKTSVIQGDATQLTAKVSVTSAAPSSVYVLNPVSTLTIQSQTGNSSVQVLNDVNVTQGTTPWTVELTSGSVITATGNSSVQVLNDVNVTQGTTPWTVQLTSGSVITTTGNSSVQVLNFPATQAVSGTVTANQGTNPWVISNSSVQVLNNVNVTQGTNPWTVQLTSGSVITTTGNSSVQVVGTMPPQSVSGVGIFNVNNTGNGSVFTVPITENRTSIFAQGSTLNAGDVASVLVFAAAGASLRNYITDWAISNTGANTTMVRFTEGGASIIGKTIAPAGGGSNMPGMGIPMRNNRQNQPVNLVVDTASSTVHYAVWGYKAA